ncbi:hypothetical protein llap_13819 [Limosa lapponica baueri]|uniref:FAT domain-containing protein n=1 Tax=Limosa lapponica baueri TaxID=1758121 RepID=A0A2I0TPZ2_LIMLA|nr:hypothetical protein llap_13819 [Limosa lapponica baueri]
MCKWCGHANQELKKASHSALDSFLKQISLMVAKDAELHKSKLQFFMEQFYGIIRRMDSSSKELSIAIRGYGLFAAPCKAIHSKDVDDMYVELLQRCKQMYLTEAETIDDHLYQLPSFLQSIASVIFHLDTIPEVYTPVLEHLVVLQINSFPQYSEKMQLVCCKSIVKDFFGKEASGSEDSREAEEVGTGRWKVPTYKDYLYLFRTLLNCDTMKDCGFEDENFLTANSPLQSLNRLLYDEFIKSILKIIEKLDLTVQKLDVNEQIQCSCFDVYFQDENETDSVLVGPTSDPASNLQPMKPTDFIAFINLVEFCREILPEKHVEHFSPWVYSFGYELVIHSTRLPLISGFYKLLSVTMKIAKKIKYFEGVSPRSLGKSPEDPEKRSCFALFVKFGKEVAAKMKQYKDELLASCLNFLLSLPHDIIVLDIKAYIPALQLGLSCTPMADLGLDALEDWSAHIPRHIMQPYYKDVLPLLDGYLKSSTSTGTTQQCCDAINHLKRIIKHKAPSLNKEGKRRVPRGFPPTKSVRLLDVVMWLLVQCGRPQTECRHKAMELFYEFVPLLPGNMSPSSWLADVLKNRDVSFLINKFEGGGSDGNSPSGILSQPTLRGVNERSSFLEAVQFFLETIALHDIHAAERCFGCSSKGSMFSPQERDVYNYSKCTIIVRIMEFVTMILETCQQDFWKVGSILNGMLDQSFRERTIRKQQGVKLVTAVLRNWKKLDSWWAKGSAPESKMAVLALLAKVLQIDSSVSFNTNHEAFTDVFNTYTSLLTDQNLGLNLKGQAVIILPFFTNLTGEKLDDLKNALDQFVAFNFPMRSDEFPKGTLRHNNYVDCTKKSNEYTFDTQVTKKMGYYKLLEVMYVRLSKEDVYSKDSKINQVYRGSMSVEGNELTKTLINLIFEKFSSGDSDTKDNSVGIQLLGIVLANNLPPFDPKCEIDRARYFQALTSNMGFLKYKEVYAAAAEVLGLALQYIAKSENVLEDPVYDCVIRQLKHHQNTQQDKFIQCLNKVVKNFPPLADRFVNAVFFLIPKLHGVMKTYCLEIIMCRAEEIPDLHLQLKSKDFIQIMNHRDDERQRVCLDIVYKMLSKLKPLELKELLPGVTGFISHPSVICRQRMYDILMWIYDNYSDPESQADGDSQEVLKLAKEILLQGLIDENAELQLIVRNFWSDETRLPANILDRMLALLNSLYSTKIETQYLSLITNFLLEMTSKSPDYSRKIFEHPLSECKFQDFVIDSSWRYRSTMLTPMFVETQGSQSVHRNLSQERSLSASGSVGGRVRATQRQYEFTPTQHVSGRSSFNWLTGSSVDTLAEYAVPSFSESLSSSMLLVNKQNEKFKQATFKPVGPDFGKKRLGLPGDEVDSKTKGIEERAEILRLRRRFLKDQDKLSLIYARKGVAEQKREKEMKSELKMKYDAQVTLYRSYRVGDLPDIQIEYCSLIAPLQGLAQKDPTFAKQLFSSLFDGIFHEVEKSKSPSEKKAIIQKLLSDFNNFLSTSLSYFPPFIACIQLEQLDLTAVHPDDAIRPLKNTLFIAFQLQEFPQFRLYRSLGDYDVLRGIFSGKIGTKEITQKALLAEARSDYAEAAKYYDEALSKEDWQDGEPTEAEKDFWELASLECYDHLTEWKPLEYCATINIDSGKPPDLSKTWNDPFFQETYLPYIIRSKLKLLLTGENDQTLLTFIDEAMKTEQKKAIIEMHYSQELSLLYILQDDFDRAKYYISNGMQIFMQSYSSIDTLLYQSRMTKLQSVQALTEIQDFINFMTKRSNLASQASLKRLLRIWTSRYPDAKMDPMNIWDDIITNRCFFLDKLQEKLLCDQSNDSMEVDEEYGAGDQMEVDQQDEDIYSMIKSCKFNMKMKMIESARKQNSFSVAKKLLKDLRKDAKTREDWLVRWSYAYCRFTHSCSRNQSCPERVLAVLKTISLLEETKSDYLSKNITAFRNQNLLLGTTYNIMANALSQDPRCLEQIEEEKAGKISALSGESLESPEKVLAGLNKKAFQCFSSAARKSEEEVQSHSMEHVDVMGVIDAYMTLVSFCDQHLRKEEEGLLEINTADLQLFPAIVVEKMIKALKLNSREARLRFPRLLQIIERYPAETLGLVTRELSSVPCWQFIGWISQMMALLDKDEAVAVQHTVEEIANTYPQAIIYPFMISSESYCFKDTATGCKNKEFVER